MRGRDRQSRQCDAEDCGLKDLAGWQAVGVGRVEIDDDTHDCAGLMWQAANAEAADLQHPGEFRGGTDDNAAVTRFDEGAVVWPSSAVGCCWS